MLSKVKSYLRMKIKGDWVLENLIKKGLVVGENFQMLFGCVIDWGHCWLIEIGNNVTLAPRVHILAHDASTKRALNYTKIGRVVIGNNVFVGAESVILPNVKVGNNVIIGAGSVVSNDIPDNSVAVGNPAKVVCTYEDYINKNKKLMETRPIFDESWTLRGNITDARKNEMIEKLKDGIGFID